MNILKRILSGVLSVAILCGAGGISAFASSYKDVPDGKIYTEAVEALTTYGVVSGYAGYFNPEAFVTRAEFAKMATISCGLEDEAYSNAAKKRFDDVPITHWGNGYINTSADNRLIMGYPDGNFMPEKYITFAEAVTVMLRALNYTSTDLGDNWPYAYMVKAKGMGITDGINLNDNDPITRGNLAVIINRVLQSKINGSQDKLLSKIDMSSSDYTDAAVIRTDIYDALATVGVSRDTLVSASVIRNGNRAGLDDAELYDVVYYLRRNNTVYLYSDKVSGIYTEAYPNKESVSSVEISGNVLEIETQTAANKLGDKMNSFSLNSKVTALLGKDGKIVDVIDLNTGSYSNTGILLSCTSEISDSGLDSGKQFNYINLLDGEGNTVKYKTNGSYSTRIGDIGKITFSSDGYASFSSLTSTNSLSGEVDKSNRKIGDKWLSQDCVILERVYTPTGKVGTAVAKKIDFNDITATQLTAKQVIHYETSGEFGDISLLIVENVTNAQYSYGVLTANNSRTNKPGEGFSASGSYTIFTNGQSRSYSTNFASSIAVGTAVALVLDGNSLVGIKALNPVKTGGSISAIDYSRIKVSGAIYPLAEDVQILKKKTGGYESIAISDTDKLFGTTANLYADTSISQGGLVRIIVIN